jgi:(E)-4-hydroxy-3-methyl-but-2-enyl pyrophosphate reductase
MKIRLAKTAGFCMGVRRAVDMVLDLQRDSPPLPVVTYGPLIHNPQTLELLKSRGVCEVDRVEDIRRGTVVIRAHGISPQERGRLEAKGVLIIDATCPRVARVQAVIRKHAGRGHFCVIVGDEDHPEVRGLTGFAAAGGIAIPDGQARDAVESVPSDRPVCVVAQTTQEEQTFDQVVAILRERCSEIHVYDTICDSTKKRQDEVGRIAQQADFIVVVGGKGSGNTRRLVKVARAQGVEALHIETADEIPPEALAGVEVVGVTAGASTPNWQIRGVIERLREIGMSRRALALKGLRRLADITVMTNGWTAMAGGGLAAACLVLQRESVSLLKLVVPMLFVFSMHLLNRIQERSGAVRFNTPEIAAFYARHRKLLTAMGGLAGVSALLLASWMGTYALLLLAAMFVTGMLYSVPLISMSRWPKWSSLKDIPGSKTPLVAIGWATAVAVLPVIDSDAPVSVAGPAVSFVFAACMVFWRTALSDLIDIQGDRIVGRETIPILIGLKDTERVLRGLLIFSVLLLVGASPAGWIPSVGYWLTATPAIYAVLFLVHKRGHPVDRLFFEGLLDASLVLAGVISLAWAAG